MYDLEELDGKLVKTLKPNRYRHTHGVMYMAGALAMAHLENINDCMTAGLLHDCGKFGSFEDQIAMCKKIGLKLSKEDLEIPALIHTKLGAALAKAEYGIEDKNILNGIRYHTTGRPHMSKLEKVIYIADFIEPWRGEGEWVKTVRDLAFKDLNKAVGTCAQLILEYLDKENSNIDNMSKLTAEFYGGR